MRAEAPRGPAGAAAFGELVAAVRAALAALGHARGLTVEEVAARYRVSPDKVRAWVRGGQLAAVNTADAAVGKPRFVVTAEALAEFERRRAAAAPAKPPRRPRRSGGIDFFPD